MNHGATSPLLLFLFAGLFFSLGAAGCGGDDDGAAANPPPALAAEGIPRALAEAREALVTNLRYDLRFSLDKGAAETRGACTLSFDLDERPGALVVDYGAGRLDELLVNGKAVPGPRLVADHIVIPGNLLAAGGNTIRARFRSPVGAGGTALTRFLDESDGCEYLYTLLVPADAHLLFPCFDQPGLKARLSLALDIPGGWTAVSNAPRAEVEQGPEGRKTVFFAETEPLSTYVMAFAAGDFTRIDDEGAAANKRPMSFYVRRSKKDKAVPADLFRLAREALGWCGKYFGAPYPFGKFAFVLVPGFPYGGMEHAGAIFFRETAAVFDREPTRSQLLRRAILFYHEISHQWFGDLVTMDWFDDLWLKEGFATFMSYKILAAVDPASPAWLRFHQSVKPRALHVDATAGTTPVYQKLDNLFDAKSAYGAIVYNKAPALLRELEFVLGEEAFRKGTRICLDRHAFGAVRWPEVFACYEEASGRDLSAWIDAWLLTKGMPVVTARWETAPGGKIGRFELFQKPVRGEGMLWPVKTRVALWYPGGRVETADVSFAGGKRRVPALEGKKTPEFVFTNYEDLAYGRFLLDSKSLENVTALLPAVHDPFLRSLLFSSLWDMVRDAAFPPADYVELALDALGREKDAVTFQLLLGRAATALAYYLGPDQKKAALPGIEDFLLAKIEGAETPAPLRLASFRSFVGLAGTKKALSWLKEILAGAKTPPPGLAVTPRDRWQIVGRLVEVGAAGAVSLFEAEKKRGGVDAPRHAFVEGAAFPDAAVKKEYFARYLEESAWPEQWLEDSLLCFNAPCQSSITLPFLRRALDELEWVKTHRKIFFMPRWIKAFVGGHQSRAALEIVEGFLKERSRLPRDIRLKVLQSLDGLERTVRIREKYAR